MCSSAAQMLAVGGVSGCTAAMFTTPFDVVKTRLQTQVALGGALRYRGLVAMFRGIVTEEGAAGLYRGLAPRLLIYMTQGALFFASYELCHRVLSAMDRPRPVATRSTTTAAVA